MDKKKEEKLDPAKPRKKTEFDKMWEKIFEEAEKPFKEDPLHPEHGKKKEPSKEDGSNDAD